MKINLSKFVSVAAQLAVAVPTIITAVRPVVAAAKSTKPRSAPDAVSG